MSMILRHSLLTTFLNILVCRGCSGSNSHLADMSSVGIGLAISISLIIGALTIDYATTAYNRMTSSPGSLGSLRWMSIFRRHQDDSSEQNTADHRDPRRSSTGLSRVSARTATGTKGRISFALPRANQSSHLLLPFKQKERTYSRISNRSLRKVHANRDLEKGSGREW